MNQTDNWDISFAQIIENFPILKRGQKSWSDDYNREQWWKNGEVWQIKEKKFLGTP